MSEIRIPVASAQEINAQIAATQPGDTLIFGQEVYRLDAPVVLLDGRSVLMDGAFFLRSGALSGRLLLYGEGTTISGHFLIDTGDGTATAYSPQGVIRGIGLPVEKE